MANAAQNDILLVTFFGRVWSQLVMLTHTYKIFSITGTIDIIDVQEALLDAVKSGGADDIESPYANCLIDAWQCTAVRAQRIYPTRARYSEVPGSEGGALESGQVSNVAGVIQLVTDSAGRSQISLKHVGPMSPEMVTASNGAWTAGALVPLGLLRDALLAPVSVLAGAVDLLPVIFHRGSVSPKFDTITDGTVQTTTRTQRTRTVGRGK